MNTENTDRKFNDSFHNDYQDIMDAGRKSTIITREWQEGGDSFKKFTMYGDYTPVETSGSTTIIQKK